MQNWEHGNITLENFVLLRETTKIEILEWRNHMDIRKNMRNTDKIEKESHLKFIESLKNNEDRAFWLVRRKQKKVGVLYMNFLDGKKRKMEWGIYLSPKYLGTGIGLEIGFEAIHFFFTNYGIQELSGFVKKSNIENIKIQKMLGFDIVGEKDELIHFSYKEKDYNHLRNNYIEFKKELFYGRKN